MLKRLVRNERGGVVVLFALALTVLVGLAGLVVDVGYLYLQHARLQNGVDAACLAGAGHLPSTGAATDAASTYATANGLRSGTLVTAFEGNNRIRLTYTEAFDTLFLKVLGIDDATIQVVAAAALPPGGPGGPAVLSLREHANIVTLAINGSGIEIDGSVHSNSQFKLNGWLTVNGDAPCSDAFAQNSFGTHVTVTGERRDHADIIQAPDYSDQINAAQANTYSGNAHFNGTDQSIDGGVSVHGNVDINGNNIVNNGSIIATGDIHNNGNAITTTGDSPILFYSSDGNIQINGNNITIDATLFAPHGDVIINGNNITITGRVIGNMVSINGSGIRVVGEGGGGTGLGSTPQLVE